MSIRCFVLDIIFKQQAQKISFSLILIIFYLLSLLAISNIIIAFILTLNVFYFLIELFHDKLFPKTKIYKPLKPVPESFPLLHSESDILPENIKKILKINNIEQVSISEEKTVDADSYILITAIQKAESLVDEKIKQLQSRLILKKSELIKVQDEIKDELAKSLPNVQNLDENWIEWSPLALHDKINHLEVYCEKCGRVFLIQDTIYEIKKEPDHFKVTASHQQDKEQHINSIKVTLESFEILSKPVLEIQQSKEVEA